MSKYGHPTGRQTIHDERACLNGLLWMLQSGIPWRLYPHKSPSASTVYRRLMQWSKDDSLSRAFYALVDLARKENRLDLTAGFIDGTVVPAKKKALVQTGVFEEWLRESCSLSTAKDFRSQYKRTALARKRFALLKTCSKKSPKNVYQNT